MAWIDTIRDVAQQASDSQKPKPGASTGLPIYPAFSDTNSQAYRLRRLEIGAQRQRGGQLQMSNGQYTRTPVNILDSQQRVDLSLGTVRKLGSVPPTANVNGFAYTSTANSITWYWDGTNGSTVIVLKRSDGTAQVIPSFGSGLTVSGLANLTTYYFLPYWSPHQTCNVGWVTGTIGSPQIAFVVADTTGTNSGFYVLEQALQDREPLTASFMTAATGGGGGSGGGGGGHGCVVSGTDIQTLGGLDYVIEVMGESQWLRLDSDDGRTIHCTWNHPLYTPEHGKTEAQTLVKGDAVIMDNGIRYIHQVSPYSKQCSKWKIRMRDGHLYYANGWLSNNQKVVTP